MSEEQNEIVNTEENVPVAAPILDESIAGILCYLFGFISGVVFLVIEKNNRFIRFHAMQSIVVTLPVFVLALGLSVLSLIPFLGMFIGLFGFLFVSLLSVCLFVVCIICMIKAYNRELFKLPVAGNIAESLLEKVKI